MPIRGDVDWKPWPTAPEPKDTAFKRVVRYSLNPGRLAVGLIFAWLLTNWNYHGQVSNAHFWETYAVWPVSCAAWAVITEIHRWAGGRKLGE